MRRTPLTILFALALCCACCLPAFAQERAGRPSARQLDAFGNVQISDFLARVDNLAIELQRDPAAKGYVVAYIDPSRHPGFPLRRAYWARGYLITGRGLDASRVEVINGGYKGEIGFEFWVADAGAEPPVKPFDLGAVLMRERTPFLFDRYDYYPPSEMGTGIENGYIGYLDEAGWFAPFVSALRGDPAARGCVIAYAEPRNRRGSDRALAALVKRNIMRAHAIGAERVVTVAGGLRRRKHVELWIVPPGSPLPKPTPDVSLSRRRRRGR